MRFGNLKSSMDERFKNLKIEIVGKIEVQEFANPLIQFDIKSKGGHFSVPSPTLSIFQSDVSGDISVNLIDDFGAYTHKKRVRVGLSSQKHKGIWAGFETSKLNLMGGRIK